MPQLQPQRIHSARDGCNPINEAMGRKAGHQPSRRTTGWTLGWLSASLINLQIYETVDNLANRETSIKV